MASASTTFNAMDLDPIDDQKVDTKGETEDDSKNHFSTKLRKKAAPWAKKSKSKSAQSTATLSTKTAMDGIKKNQPRSQKQGKQLVGAVRDFAEDENDYKSRLGEECEDMEQGRRKKRMAERTDWSRRALEDELAGLQEEESEYRERLGRNEDQMMEDQAERPRRRPAVQNLGMGMKDDVDDIAAKIGELGMGKDYRKQA